MQEAFNSSFSRMRNLQFENSIASTDVAHTKKPSIDEQKDSLKLTNPILSADEKKKKFDAIIKKLNAVTNSQVDTVPTKKLQMYYEQKYSLNELSFLDNMLAGESRNSINSRQSVSKVNFAATLINQEEILRKAILAQETQLKTEAQIVESYKKIYEELRPDRFIQSELRASFEADPSSRISPDYNYINIMIKDAIYVLDPKFVSVVGTYLRLYSETQTKITKTVSDYLRPNWNENIYFRVHKDCTRINMEFVLIEKDEYGINKDTIFGKGSLIMEQPKDNETSVSKWHSIYNIFNTKAEIGKINLVYDVLPSEPQAVEKIIQEKDMDMQAIRKNLTNVQDELFHMQHLFSGNTLPNEEFSTAHGHISSRNQVASTLEFIDVNKQDEAFLPFSSYNKNRYEKLRNYLVLALILLAVVNCFYRPDFFSLVLGLVSLFYLPNEWTEAIYLKSQIGLTLSLLFDSIWLIYKLFTSPHHNESIITRFSALPIFLMLVEMTVKVLLFINVFKLAQMKRKAGPSLSEGLNA